MANMTLTLDMSKQLSARKGKKGVDRAISMIISGLDRYFRKRKKEGTLANYIITEDDGKFDIWMEGEREVLQEFSQDFNEQVTKISQDVREA